MTPKRVVILGVTAVIVLGGGGFTVYTAIQNSKTHYEGTSPEEWARIAAGDFYSPDPKSDAYKASAVTAYNKDRLKKERAGVDKLDPIVIETRAPGGDGFPPANFPPGSNPSPGSNKATARDMLSGFGFGLDQWGCLEKLWHKESGWNERAMNRYSGAYGIPQSLPGSKMASAGSDWQTNAATQIKWGLGYIKGRYGTPCGAWGHSQAKGWY
ncbi:lytic transglycosylase domain-containing protein [Nonomuraea typhae]|uniref:aggregation-promoting factor C-terminal-like domain-containing protein n=1 Tax=Nonomuraea typhae TaxID=2603600 RepID=UPI0012FCDAE3|nr:lytic transglycosylase domain-containing protein [Nonomuraea typhae]